MRDSKNSERVTTKETPPLQKEDSILRRPKKDDSPLIKPVGVGILSTVAFLAAKKTEDDSLGLLANNQTSPKFTNLTERNINAGRASSQQPPDHPLQTIPSQTQSTLPESTSPQTSSKASSNQDLTLPTNNSLLPSSLTKNTLLSTVTSGFSNTARSISHNPPATPLFSFNELKSLTQHDVSPSTSTSPSDTPNLNNAIGNNNDLKTNVAPTSDATEQQLKKFLLDEEAEKKRKHLDEEVYGLNRIFLSAQEDIAWRGSFLNDLYYDTSPNEYDFTYDPLNLDDYFKHKKDDDDNTPDDTEPNKNHAIRQMSDVNPHAENTEKNHVSHAVLSQVLTENSESTPTEASKTAGL